MAGENHHTAYIVLRADADGHWIEVAEVAAHNANAAAVRAAKDHIDPALLETGVQLRAVPARSWNAGAAHLKAQHQTRIVPT